VKSSVSSTPLIAKVRGGKKFSSSIIYLKVIVTWWRCKNAAHTHATVR